MINWLLTRSCVCSLIIYSICLSVFGACDFFFFPFHFSGYFTGCSFFVCVVLSFLLPFSAHKLWELFVRFTFWSLWLPLFFCLVSFRNNCGIFYFFFHSHSFAIQVHNWWTIYHRPSESPETPKEWILFQYVIGSFITKITFSWFIQISTLFTGINNLNFSISPFSSHLFSCVFFFLSRSMELFFFFFSLLQIGFSNNRHKSNPQMEVKC